jgi:8-amino-7-oxononanoate synthase
MDVTAFLRDRREQGLLRQMRTIEKRERGRIVVQGREYVDLSSNDYLGLSGHSALREAAAGALTDWGTSAASSRLLSGSTVLHRRLEERVAAFKGKEAALVFNSGYQANLGLLQALCDDESVVFADKLSHASIIDGLRLAGALCVRFRHNDSDHLRQLLQKRRGERRKAFIVTETVFSMDGDVCPLGELVRLKDEYDCMLIVDEAHATGLFGETGAGLVEETGLNDRVDVIMGTFSKALGSFGAYVAASGDIADYLVNCARSFIFSTALPPSVIAANIAAIDVVIAEPERRDRVLIQSRRLRDRLRSQGLLVPGESQIVPVVLGDNGRTTRAAEVLRDRGWWLLPIRHPTVPSGQARLRLSVTYDQEPAVLEKLADDIVDVCTDE